MNIEMAMEKGNKMEFLLKGGSTSFANLIRRFGMGQVPVFAIDSVTFYENSSAMFDEYLAHRLGQVPLLSDSGRAAEEIGLTLEATGPGTVYSRELKSTDAKVKAAIADIPLLKLLEGQLSLRSKVTSPYTGRVIEVLANEGMVYQMGSPLIRIEPMGRDVKSLEAVLFVSSLTRTVAWARARTGKEGTAG